MNVGEFRRLGELGEVCLSPLWKVCPLDTSSADSFPAKILTVSHRVTQNAQPLVPHTASESATITDHSDSTLTHLKKNPVLSSSNSQDRGPGPKARAVAAERDSAEEDRGVKGPPDPSSTSPLRVLNQTFKHLKDGNRLPSSDRTSRHPIAIAEGLTYIALTAARDGDLFTR